MTTKDGYLRLDANKRVSLGRYTELEPGEYYRVTSTPNGELILTPAAAGK